MLRSGIIFFTHYSATGMVSIVPWVEVGFRAQVSMSHPTLKCLEWIMGPTLLSAMWNVTVTHTPDIRRGVTIPWGDSRLDILSLEVSCAPPMWHSSLLPIFSWAKGSSGAASWRTDIYTFMNVNRQADISICALRTQHRSLEGLPRQKIEKRIHILSFIDPQPIVLKVDMALFPLKSIFYDITCYCSYIVFESIF